jgi:hypothetical protein
MARKIGGSAWGAFTKSGFEGRALVASSPMMPRVVAHPHHGDHDEREQDVQVRVDAPEEPDPRERREKAEEERDRGRGPVLALVLRTQEPPRRRRDRDRVGGEIDREERVVGVEVRRRVACEEEAGEGVQDRERRRDHDDRSFSSAPLLEGDRLRLSRSEEILQPTREHPFHRTRARDVADAKRAPRVRGASPARSHPRPTVASSERRTP